MLTDLFLIEYFTNHGNRGFLFTPEQKALFPNNLSFFGQHTMNEVIDPPHAFERIFSSSQRRTFFSQALIPSGRVARFQTTHSPVPLSAFRLLDYCGSAPGNGVS